MAIIPIVGEAVWQNRLRGLAAYELPCVPTVVVSPHPDDETLGAGGLIAALRDRGTEVTVVAVTDGEGAYDDVAGLAAIREEEQRLALARLGVDEAHIVRLRLPDRDVSAHESELVVRLKEIVKPGSHLVAPWRGDFHPDHEACGRAAERVAAEVGVPLTSYLFWAWHRGTVETLADVQMRALLLEETHRARKLEALACHVSQLQHAVEPILPEELLSPARREFEVYLS